MGEIVLFRGKEQDAFQAVDESLQGAEERQQGEEGDNGSGEGEIIELGNKKCLEFMEEYKEIIDNAPKFDMGLQMQYYAGVMLGYVDAIFHEEGGWRKPFDVFDFFYYNFFCEIAAKFTRYYQHLEREYPFTGKLTYNADKLENLLTTCLKTIIGLHPEDNDEHKTELMYEANRMFEIWRNMVYYSMWAYHV